LENQNKVAKITIYFWIMKIFATTLGETFGDHLSMTYDIGYAISLLITIGFFIIVLLIQLKSDKFHAGLYWLVIVGSTSAGTEVSDLMDRTLGLGYAFGSLILFSLLMITLYLWHHQEKGIRVYPVTEKRVELYYWIAILISNSLGTAFGDYLTDNIGLSYLTGAGVTSAIILIVIFLHHYTKLNEILLFWIAFIFTRPFGATFGDLLTKPLSKGGLDLGTGAATIVTALILSSIIWYSIRKEKITRIS
jgi:uncharacterized membrane-anchored protein